MAVTGLLAMKWGEEAGERGRFFQSEKVTMLAASFSFICIKRMILLVGVTAVLQCFIYIEREAPFSFIFQRGMI